MKRWLIGIYTRWTGYPRRERWWLAVWLLAPAICGAGMSFALISRLALWVQRWMPLGMGNLTLELAPFGWVFLALACSVAFCWRWYDRTGSAAQHVLLVSMCSFCFLVIHAAGAAFLSAGVLFVIFLVLY